MSDDRHDNSLLIGLHKLAEQNGDGLVPELYALLARRQEIENPASNVVAFPEVSRSAASDIPPGRAAKILTLRR